MQENQNLQDEINQILDNTQAGQSPQVSQPQQPASETAPVQQSQQAAPVIMPVQEPQQQPTQGQYEQQYVSQLAPAAQIPDTAQTQSGSPFSFFRNLPQISILIGVGVVVVAGLIIFILRGGAGPRNFADCIELEGATVVTLEPAYCVAPDGDVFYKNKADAPPTNAEGPVETFDPNNPPETILPESL